MEAKERLQKGVRALQREILVFGSKKQRGGARIQRARRAAAKWQHSETSMNDSADKGKTHEPSQAVTVAKTKMDQQVNGFFFLVFLCSSVLVCLCFCLIASLRSFRCLLRVFFFRCPLLCFVLFPPGLVGR